MLAPLKLETAMDVFWLVSGWIDGYLQNVKESESVTVAEAVTVSISAPA